MHLRGVATPMKSANKPYYHHIKKIIIIYIINEMIIHISQLFSKLIIIVEKIG